MMRLLLWLDVTVGHNIVLVETHPILDWLFEPIVEWWYVHICVPAGMWECRD